jgi:hypothetical protein
MSKFIPAIEKYLLKKRVINKLQFAPTEIQYAYPAGSRQLGTDNPFNCLGLRKELDNRSQENLEITYVYLRTYIDGAVFGHIIWHKAEPKDAYRGPQDLCTYPGSFRFPKNTKSTIQFGISIPPFVALDDLYVGVSGYLTLKSVFGSFNLPISDISIFVDKAKWSGSRG